MEIELDGTPHILIRSQTYQCHQGRDFNVSKKIYNNKAKAVLFRTVPYQITKTSTTKKENGVPSNSSD